MFRLGQISWGFEGKWQSLLPPSAKGVGIQLVHSLVCKKEISRGWLCQFQREDSNHGSGECFCHAGPSQHQYNLLQPTEMPKYRSKPQKFEFPLSPCHGQVTNLSIFCIMGLGAPLDTLLVTNSSVRIFSGKFPQGGSGAGASRRPVLSDGNLPQAVQVRALETSGPTRIQKGLAAARSSCHMELDFLLFCKKSQGAEGKPFPGMRQPIAPLRALET